MEVKTFVFELKQQNGGQGFEATHFEISGKKMEVKTFVLELKATKWRLIKPLFLNRSNTF